VRRALARQRLSGTAVDEVLSTLETRLFFPLCEAPPAILGYAGVGSFESWVRAVALRAARRAARHERQRERVIIEESGAPSDDDPELGYLQRLYGEEARRSVFRAVGKLSARERSLLRQHYLDALGVEALAEMHHVHRVTIFRWLKGAYQVLSSELRSDLGRCLGLRGDGSTIERVLFVARNGLHEGRETSLLASDELGSTNDREELTAKAR